MAQRYCTYVMRKSDVEADAHCKGQITVEIRVFFPPGFAGQARDLLSDAVYKADRELHFKSTEEEGG